MKANQFSEIRGDNVLDTGAPWYNVYETKDGKYVSIGSIEARFFEELIQRLELANVPPQHDRSRWPEMKALFEKTFHSRTRDEWVKAFEGSDACFAPVLSFSESRRDPHNAFRKSTIEVKGVEQPAPAPRYSRTPATVPACAARAGRGRRASSPGLGF